MDDNKGHVGNSFATSATENFHNRRLLHQPIFPLDHSFPPTTPPTLISQPPFTAPSPQPQPQQQQPKYPFSTLSPPDIQNQFFLVYPSLPPHHQPPSSSNFATFPTNISSLILIFSSSHSNKHISHKLIVVIISVAILSAALFATFLHPFLRRHDFPIKQTAPVSSFLTPPPLTPLPPPTSVKKSPPPPFPRHTPFLHLFRVPLLGNTSQLPRRQCQLCRHPK
ncbi:formin-like protein 2 [Forsythia ovata]|uniref:Formin-like protein 2 n=1 Tax=Forsythia ovata TaxID=205694 RepID=A0ABD1XE89_9LAMI